MLNDFTVISEKVKIGKLKFKEMNELFVSGKIIADLQFIGTKKMQMNRDMINTVKVDKKAVEEVSNLLLENKYVGGNPIVLAVVNDNEFKIIEGFHLLLSIAKVVNELPENLVDVMLLNMNDEEIKEYIESK